MPHTKSTVYSSNRKDASNYNNGYAYRLPRHRFLSHKPNTSRTANGHFQSSSRNPLR